MDSIKYRKLYLSENYGFSNFKIIKEKIKINRCFPCPYSINFQRDHPRVLSGEAFWISHNELCIGYISSKNASIFRPIFSYKRQRLLNRVNSDIMYPYKFWNKVISKYFKMMYQVNIYEKRKIPIECIKHILKYIH